MYRLLVQLGIIVFVCAYEVWYAKGYQTSIGVDASLTTKVKGISM